MLEIITVGLDLAKNVFQAHGADGAGRTVLRKRLQRGQVSDFFSRPPTCVAAMEGCGGAHFWGREIGKLGHEVGLIPPAYVKLFVKRQKMGCRPLLTASQCADVVVFNATRRRGRRLNLTLLV